jgi:osmotically inducible protein OsmC
MSLAESADRGRSSSAGTANHRRVTLASVGSGFDITRIALTTEGEGAGGDDDVFADLARKAKNCTVSRALAGTEITLEARLAAS